mmetsp:Transcript_20150/g.22416  ORF Transcript_20150/g.22416 Transcript_20150/m.22416 type:complete len:231 (+) Transcript_20150:88-780(+)
MEPTQLAVNAEDDSTSNKRPSYILNLPTEIIHDVLDYDKHVYLNWPLLCKEAAIKSRYNEKLQQDGKFIGKFRRPDYGWYTKYGYFTVVCFFSNGKKDGRHTTYYEDGQKYTECLYIDGKIKGEEKTWFKSGKILEITTHSGGFKCGLSESFYENGQKYSSVNFKFNRKEGTETTWYEDGQMKSLKNYKRSVLDGEFITWWENGNKQQEITYDRGDIVTNKRWTRNGEIE